MQDNLELYYRLLDEIKSLNGILSLLSWDQEALMPPLAINERAKQRSIIETLIHTKTVSQEFNHVVNSLYDNYDKLDTYQKRSIYLSKRTLDRNSKLPHDFIEEFSNLKSQGQNAWINAKLNEDFSKFKPYLEKIFDHTKRYAQYIDSNQPIYDVLLDDYEEGMTTLELKNIFKNLRQSLLEIIPNIDKRDKIGVFEFINFDKDITKKLLSELIQKIGFLFTKGTIGEVHHPFETKISDNDVRINTKYIKNNLSYSITSMVHELGHGLYEQNVKAEYYNTSFGDGISLAIHESQSRMLENMIGRSKAFWEYAMPLVSKYYPALSRFSSADAYNDLNIVKPTFIRTESDELTYNMHIILRFEIEQQILNNEISIDNIPDIWNSKMKELLGISPNKLSQGCLQDVHWSMGAIGYFPTYSLGNLVSAQLWNKFNAENLEFNNKLAKGDFSEYFNWFKNNVWQNGALYTTKELLLNVTGEELNANYLIKYLKNKYTNGKIF